MHSAGTCSLSLLDVVESTPKPVRHLSEWCLGLIVECDI